MFLKRRLNLQQFGGPMLNPEGGGGAPAGGDPAPAPAAAPPAGGGDPGIPEPVNPLLAGLQGGEPPAQPPGAGQPPAAPPAQPPVELDFGGRKVTPNDPNSLQQLHGDWQELNRTYQSQLQANQQLQQQMLQLMQAQAQPAQPPQPAQPQPPSPEKLKEINDKYWEMAYENKVEADAWLQQQPEYQQQMSSQFQSQVEAYVQKHVMPLVQPIVQEREYSQQANQLSQKYPDFVQHVPQIRQLFQQNPALADMPGGMEYAYLAAKGMTAQSQPAPTPEQMLQDPNFIQQILGNEQIRNQMISQYVTNRSDTNQQIPPVMGNQPGGSPPAMPPEEPKSWRDATKAFLSSMGTR